MEGILCDMVASEPGLRYRAGYAPAAVTTAGRCHGRRLRKQPVAFCVLYVGAEHQCVPSLRRRGDEIERLLWCHRLWPNDL